jgi:CRP/FNR family transcriptional regulator, cyclic AMP receptor protein
MEGPQRGTWQALSRLPPGVSERLANATRLHVRAGRTIISQGDTSTNVYVVREGRLQVMLFSSDGRETILRTIAEGELFGEIAAIDDRPRSATIVALSDCVLASIDARSFRTAIEEIPGASIWLARRLANHIRDLTRRLLERNALRVRSRMHCELLRRCREVSADQDIVILKPSPTHAELASCIGTHREAITREMSHLVERGIVRQERRQIIIEDAPALARLVQMAVGDQADAIE